MRNLAILLLASLLFASCGEQASDTSSADGNKENQECTGQKGCSCYGNGTCDEGLSCISGTCVGCEENNRKCYGTEVQVCDDSGNWEFYRDCAPDCCENGQCVNCSSVDGDNSNIDGDVDTPQVDGDQEDDTIVEDGDIESDGDLSIDGDADSDESEGDIEGTLISPDVIVLPTDVADASYMDSDDIIIPKSVAKQKNRNQLEDLERLAPNKILVGEKHPDGTSAGIDWRILQVVDEGDNWRVRPNLVDPRPTLAEIVEHGTVDSSTTIPFENEGVLLRNRSFGFGDEQSICSGEAGLDATVDIGVNFEPQFDFTVETGYFSVQYIRAYMGGHLEASAELYIEGILSGDCTSASDDAPIWSVPHDVVVIVGGVPVVIRVEPRIYLGYSVHAGGDLNVSGGASADTNVGIELVYDGDWQQPAPVFEFNRNYVINEVELNFNAHAKAWVRVEVSAKVYGIAGPYLGAKPEAGIIVDMHPDTEYYWGVYFSNSFYAGCRVEILGTTLADYRVDDLGYNKWDLANGCVTGVCCQSLYFKPNSVVCNSNASTEYQCTPSQRCGSEGVTKAQQRTGIQYCSGSSADCAGSIAGNWSDIDTCEDHELCYTSENDAGCRVDAACFPCNDHGTWNGSSCNCDQGYAGSYCDKCDDGFTDYPNCNSDCSGHGTWNGIGCSCTQGFDGSICDKCADGYTDYPNCKENRWRDNGNGTVTDTEKNRTWMKAVLDYDSDGQSDAISMCNSSNYAGHSDWRLPKIQELRSLISGCPGREEEGACPVTDPDCLDGCYDNDTCGSCGLDGGPGSCGSYWEPGVWEGSCNPEERRFWSSSQEHSEFWNGSEWVEDISGIGVDFSTGQIIRAGLSNAWSVRCVR